VTVAVDVRAPAEQAEGTRSQILRWLKAVGERVTANEPLIEIETDKVTVEVASPGSGILREIVKQEQDEIAPGELLGRIEGDGDAVASRNEGAGEGAVGGSLVARGVAGMTRSAPAMRESAAAGQDMPHDEAHAGEAIPRGGASSDGSAGHALSRPNSLTPRSSLSPAVRRLLAEHGLEAAAVSGTGLQGRITVEDVLRQAATEAASPAVRFASVSSPARSLAPAASPQAQPSDLGPSHRVPHSPVRRRIAEHMVQSLLQTAPHVTTVFDANLSAVLAHRERNREDFAQRGAPLTLTAYFLQAAVAAIRAVPEANSRWSDAALEIFESIHIGVATALDTGLVVPVLKDAQSLDLFETARRLAQIVSKAREGRLAPADVRGGTFTISNHGVSGSLLATPIVINQPQAAILGVGKLERRPVVVTGVDGADQIVVQARCYVTLTIDHRVMDGEQANHFLQTFVGHVETAFA
jgi:2-oxoglutarate dehydrogenase E2 component (dihydrolipoamide succinyltransferase)